jgi:hypothetical protein
MARPIQTTSCSGMQSSLGPTPARGMEVGYRSVLVASKGSGFASSVEFGTYAAWIACNGCLPTTGTFRLTLEFTEDYPNKAPVVKFKSTMFHPNSE